MANLTVREAFEWNFLNFDLYDRGEAKTQLQRLKNPIVMVSIQLNFR